MKDSQTPWRITSQIHPMPSKWETIFSVKEKDGEFKIVYDHDLDYTEKGHKLAGALYLLMKEYPELIEELLFAAGTSAENLSQPFNDILNDI